MNSKRGQVYNKLWKTCFSHIRYYKSSFYATQLVKWGANVLGETHRAVRFIRSWWFTPTKHTLKKVARTIQQTRKQCYLPLRESTMQQSCEKSPETFFFSFFFLKIICLKCQWYVKLVNTETKLKNKLVWIWMELHILCIRLIRWA